MRHVTRRILPATVMMGVGLVMATRAQQPAPPATAPRIPLRLGLTIVTALNDPETGDYESIKTVTEANDKGVRLAYSAEVPVNESPNPFGGSRGAAKPTAARVKRFNVNRIVSRPDLENAVEYRCLYSDMHPESFPGSTAVGVSRRVLSDLKTTGQSPLRICAFGIMGGLASVVNGLFGKDSPTAGMDMLAGTLKRVEPRGIPFKVVVNDTPVELPVIHGRGKFDVKDAELWILDDPENPLAMKWDIGDEHLQVIRLAFPTAADTVAGGGGTPAPKGRGAISSSGGAAGAGGAPGSTASGGAGPAGGAGAGAAAAGKTGAGSGAGTGGAGSGAGAAGAGTVADPAAAKRIETDLSKTGRTIIYGIYFDFASDRIKKESEPVLAEIAQVMKQQSTWNISVEGHTDNIGGDAYNLDLSQRRAAAVKQALISRYGIDEHRMQTTGFGMRVPKDRNDTIEGRARNRRVELVKRD
jgi:outer membrane protein OmpA-like peptidoglycan-associated protein